MHKSQKQRIIAKLKRDGTVSRNECLRNYISRLGAIICLLKKQGWEFETSEKDGDYIYTWTNKKPKVEWECVERNGERVAIIKEVEPKNLNLL
jgi:hypothetical protein